MSTHHLRNEFGPYKATKLWNDIVRVFRTGMPIGKHWKQLRCFDDCFVASEAIDWLLEYLQQHHDSGPVITRPQVIKLLQKFHRTHYIEDVRGPKYDSELFDDGNRFFRFCALSPLKTPQWSRVNSHPNSHHCLDEVKKPLTFSEEEVRPGSPKELIRITAQQDVNACKSPLPKVSVGSKVTDNVWKDVVFESLQQVLMRDDVVPLFDASFVNTAHIRHNLTIIHKSGYVTGINKHELPPSWIVSAMKYLAKWPDKGTDAFPEYPGFEKDVFMMIKEYFDTYKEPLTTFSLYSTLLNVYCIIDKLQPSPIQTRTSHLMYVSDTTPQRRVGEPLSLANDQDRLPNDRMPVNMARLRRTHSACHGNHQIPVHSKIYSSHSFKPPKSASRASRDRPQYTCTVYDVPRPQSCDSSCSQKHPQPQSHSSKGSSQPAAGSWDRPSRQSCRYRSHSPPSYYEAVMGRNPPFNDDYFFVEQNRNNNANDRLYCNDCDYQRRPGSHERIHKAASLSHLLVGPRVETAFVGDEARTVYYGIQRMEKMKNMQRSCINLADPLIPNYKHQSNPKRDTLGCGVSSRSCVDLSKSQHTSSWSASHAAPPKDCATTYYSCVNSAANYSSRDSFPNRYLSSQDLSHMPETHPVNASPTLSSGDYIQTSHFRYGSRCLHIEDNGTMKPRLYSTPSMDTGKSPFSLFGEVRDQRLIRAFQLVLLLLPPSNRRILHMVLKLMFKASHNAELVLHSEQPASTVVLFSLWRIVMRSGREASLDEVTSVKIVEFLVNNYAAIMSVPTDVRDEIENRICSVKKEAEKVTERHALKSCSNTAQPKVPPKALDRLGISPSKTVAFCQRVTAEEYESHKHALSRGALTELLSNIIDDSKMSKKEKTKKLKQFQRAYPEIFEVRFPTADALKIVLQNVKQDQPKIKALLLPKPMELLRKLR